MAFTEKELEVQKEYLDTLNTLNCNSKPLIDVLTDIAEESREFARVIVKCIEDQLEKVSVELKLPILYLIDSIIKKEQDDPVYTPLFCCRLHLLFAKVYKEGKDDVRKRLSKLRDTWNGVLPSVILSALDNEVRKVNPTWQSGTAVHVNPKFFPGSTAVPFVINSMKTENISQVNPSENTKKYMLLKRQQEYIALKKKAERLARMKAQPPVRTDEKNDRISSLTNQIFTDAAKLKDGADNPSDIKKVRESADAIRSSLLKSREQLIKDTGHCNHATLNELISKLESTIVELDRLIASQKAGAEKNHLSNVPATLAAPASKPNVSKSGTMPRAWLPKNSPASLLMSNKSASNGTTPAALHNSPAIRIAPVNSQLIKAVTSRPRDPRLMRKLEEQESKTTVSKVTATVEEKVSPAPAPIDTKNDKKNVLFPEVSKTKDFVSDVTSTSSAPAVSPRPAKGADLKTVVQVDRKNDRQSEKGSSPSKSSKSNHIESSRHEAGPVSKSSGPSSSSSVTKKEDPSSHEAGSSNIESIIPAAPSISGEKPTRHKKDYLEPKKESKPTKIRVKVIQKGTKEKSSKRTANIPSEPTAESMTSSTSRNGSQETANEKTVPMTREARNKKLNALADTLAKCDEKRRQVFLEDLSKPHLKVAQKLAKLVKKKLATAGAKPIAAEVPTPPAPPISKIASPIIIDELMDITDDKNDFDFVSGSNSSEPQEKTPSSTVTTLDQTEAVVHATNEISDEVDSRCEAVSVPMDISEDSGEKTLQPIEEYSPSKVEKETEKSAPKSPTTPLNLSEQLEAVMNASSSDAISSPVTQDVDIRPLLPNSIGLKLNCPLPVVPDIIAPAVPMSTDSVDPSTTAPFNNPFGLSRVPTQDIDYRQLFGFPLPTIPSGTEPVIQPASSSQVSSSVPDGQSAAGPTPIDVDDLPADKVATKRKPEDEPPEAVKRRRTISVSSTSSGASDSESQPAAATVVKSRSPEPQPSTLPLPPLASALENILNVPSDSDEDVVESMDGDDKAGSSRGKREQSNYSLTAVVNEDEHSSDASMVPPMEPRPASKSPPMFPMLTPNPSFCTPNFGMFLSATPEIPEANADVLKMIRRDPVRTIHIDGISREIRHYGSTAVTFLSWDDPRQISFYNGLRRIIIDNDVEIPCYLNGPDVEYKLYGMYHRFRLGAPTRELYIDGIGYECYFDGSAKRIRVGNMYRSVRLAGGPPRVHIGQKKRQDLVAGKIDIIIDEEHTSPVYLDAKPQAIYVKGIPFIIMFIDSLKRVLINDVPFRTAFGGLPQSFKFKNKVFSFRFDMLPAGIVPGAVSIFQMIMTKLPSPPPLPPSLRYCEDLPPIYPPSVPNIPMSSGPKIDTTSANISENAPSELKPPPMTGLLENVNIDELFQKLVASGIVPTPHHSDETESKPIVESKRSVEHHTVKYVDFSKPETLKQKQPALISKLYSGIQCGSCGLRFPQEQTVKYSQHLDWHFRLNRRGKDGARMIHSRKWYYNSSNWMQFQEMEDNSDRGTSWFENQAATEYTEKEEEEVPCVSAGENAQDAVCVLCQDKFDQFYNQDIEEWQLRNAIRVDGILYHPTCHQDHTERKDDHSDVEEIVDLEEPIALDDSTPVEEFSVNLLENEIAGTNVDSSVATENAVDENNTDLNKIVTISDDSIVIKQEKPDAPKLTVPINDSQKSTIENEEMPAIPASSENDAENEDDSDVEEVQLIEQPIEEIIINDDINDLEPNLETLNVEDIIAVQKEVDSLAEETVAEVEPVEIVDKIVDITSVPNVATIDGNIELGDSLQVVSTGTKIKLNIAKPATHNEEKPSSPKSPANEVEPVSDAEMDDLMNGPPKELTTINAQPLPPGEELVTAAEIKPRLKERKLTEYPPVAKGTETSGLCSIM